MTRRIYWDWRLIGWTVAGVIGFVLLLMLAGCRPDRIEARSLTATVRLQATTATVTARWSPPSNAQPGWTLAYNWHSNRVSGGDAWTQSGSTVQTSVSFEVPRGVTTDAVGRFCVATQRVAPDPAASADVCVEFTVPHQTTPPPLPPDSVQIEVVEASVLLYEGDSAKLRLTLAPDPDVRLYELRIYSNAADTEGVWVLNSDASFCSPQCNLVEYGERCPCDRERWQPMWLTTVRVVDVGDGLIGGKVVARGRSCYDATGYWQPCEGEVIGLPWTQLEIRGEQEVEWRLPGT